MSGEPIYQASRPWINSSPLRVVYADKLFNSFLPSNYGSTNIYSRARMESLGDLMMHCFLGQGSYFFDLCISHYHVCSKKHKSKEGRQGLEGLDTVAKAIAGHASFSADNGSNVPYSALSYVSIGHFRLNLPGTLRHGRNGAPSPFTCLIQSSYTSNFSSVHQGQGDGVISALSF